MEKLTPQVYGKPLDHSRALAKLLLLLKNLAPDGPVGQDEFWFNRNRCPNLSLLIPRLEVLRKLRIAPTAYAPVQWYTEGHFIIDIAFLYQLL